MKHRLCFLTVAALLAASAALAQLPQRPDEAHTRGAQVPDVTLIGADSTTFALSTLAGKPVLVNPIFTECPQVCPMITTSLRDALAGIGEPGVGYHVVTISFDPADGPAEMREYARKLELPAGWTLAVATPENLRALMDAIDFNYEPAPEGGFMHANAVAILTPTLRVSSYAHGLSYDAKELRAAFEKATAEASFVRHYRPYIALAGVLALTAVVAALFVTRKKPAQV